jgi:ABC-type lipoprotein export system ATPase subunit
MLHKMIEIKSLSFAYPHSTALSFPDFSVKDGEHCLLLGESGSGKTTLLHVLGGLLRGYNGSVAVKSVELSSLSETQLDAFRGRHMGFIFQKNHLINALTVEKNLWLAPYLSGAHVNQQRVTEVLQRLGIEQKRKSNVTEISQGQAQRVAIARAVLNKPSVIIADEPTSALDDKSCEHVINLLLEVATENNASLIIATHDQRLKDKISNKVLLSSGLHNTH